MRKIKNLEYSDGKILLLDQTRLPLREEYIVTDDYERIAEAIEKLEIRGAPAIGLAAAFACALSLRNIEQNHESEFRKAVERLRKTRPTAVNLFWALDRMENKFRKCTEIENVYESLIEEAEQIFEEDRQMCERIAGNGLQLFSKVSRVLTHCNTGALVSGGGGTAFYIIQKAFESGLVDHVYADETRPLLQGSRLTAYELDKSGIPFSIITDSSAAFVMKYVGIDLIVVGADRIALNGDTANKIGTYNLAVLAKYHNVPFYIAAPSSTIDKNCFNGNSIDIEFRSGDEIRTINGHLVTRPDFNAYSPAFDITPNELISGIITEENLFKPPYKF
ncbi:MAG: S-methyl-5-thioribose-1-phosphate isomerase [Melioribacteraceae bacterium]|nr:S-methyl-5-thioribose-1-phosphate isomerase [Melioribacteraceae bacterium]